MNPLVSIIIPAYNAASYISNCLDSVCNQRYKALEVFVINDCSTDNTQTTVEQYIESHEDVPIKLLNLTKNAGVSHARNEAFKKANGKYIYLLDSDDDISFDCIEKLVSLAESEQYDLVVGENYLISDEERKHIKVEVLRDSLRDEDILKTFTLHLWYNQPWNKLVRRDVIETNRLYFAEGHILEDELWSFQLAASIHSMAFLKQPIYNYYIRKGSIISSVAKRQRRWDEFFCINSLISQFIKEQQLDKYAYVGKYFLTNLLVNMGGFQQNNSLNYQAYRKFMGIVCFDIHTLWREKLLTTREYIAYYYFSLPSPIGIVYYLLMNTLHAFKYRVNIN